VAPRKNNTNALKHGLYAAHFADAEDQAALSKMPMDDLRQEIAALRFIGERILAEITTPAVEATDARADRITKLSNSFVNAVTAIGGAMRTQALLQGTYNPLDDAIDQALKGFDPYEETK